MKTPKWTPIQSMKVIVGFDNVKCTCYKGFPGQGCFDMGCGDTRFYNIADNCPVHKNKLKNKTVKK